MFCSLGCQMQGKNQNSKMITCSNKPQLSSFSSCFQQQFFFFFLFFNNWLIDPMMICGLSYRLKNQRVKIGMHIIHTCLVEFFNFYGFLFFDPLSLKLIIMNVMCRPLHKGTPECKHGETATWLFISWGAFSIIFPFLDCLSESCFSYLNTVFKAF